MNNVGLGGDCSPAAGPGEGPGCRSSPGYTDAIEYMQGSKMKNHHESNSTNMTSSYFN